MFLAVQTIRNRTFFVEPLAAGVTKPADNLRRYDRSSLGKIGQHAVLAHRHDFTGRALGRTIGEAGRPWNRRAKCSAVHGWCADRPDCIGPEAMSALRAALDNQLQRAVNLCLGSVSSTIGLTVPAILVIGLITGQPVVLGLAPTSIVLLAVTLVLCTITFCGPSTTVL